MPSLARTVPSLARAVTSLARAVASLARAVPSLARAVPSLARAVLKPSPLQPRGTRRPRLLVLTDGWDGWMDGWDGRSTFFFTHYQRLRASG